MRSWQPRYEWRNVSRDDLLASCPEVNAKLADKEVEEIFLWMARSTFLDDWFDINGEFQLRSLAEHTLCQCELIDPEDESVWLEENGGAWDAAFVYGKWVELMQQGDESDD